MPTKIQQKPVAGSSNSNAPRHIKEIIDEIIQRNLLFNNIFPNTELDVVLKLLTRTPGRLSIGDCMQGAIVRDEEYHYTFIEDAHEADAPEAVVPEPKYARSSGTTDASAPVTPVASEKKGTRAKRNPIVIPGNCVNLHCKDDGTLFLTFRYPVLTEHYTWKNFCIEAAQEILSLTGLVEDKSSKART